MGFPGEGNLIMRGVAYVLASVAHLWSKATKDGALAAAGRQGADEIGSALKAFPESIQSQEPGTIFNPTQGEIAASRKDSVFGHSHTPPSEIVSRLTPQAAPMPLRAPSEIIDAKKAMYGAEQSAGHQSEQSTFWRGRINAERAGSEGGNAGGQNEQAEGRALSEEQKEREGRGR
jgi:hypothetical protein